MTNVLINGRNLMSKINYAAHLREAKELISDPKHWAQGAAARDARGEQCPIKSNVAVAFCAYGACEHVGDVTVMNFLDRAALTLCGRANAVALNDAVNTTHELVMQMFDMAIAEAEALA